MITVTLEQFLKNSGSVLGTAKSEGILLTEDGKPKAVLIKVEDMDAEDEEYASSPEFRAMIEEARKSPGVPWEEAKRRILEGAARDESPAGGG